jgi:hypothetical protein
MIRLIPMDILALKKDTGRSVPQRQHLFLIQPGGGHHERQTFIQSIGQYAG